MNNFLIKIIFSLLYKKRDYIRCGEKIRGVFPVRCNGKNATNFFPPNIMNTVLLKYL